MSERRAQVLALIEQGLSHKDAAERLGCSRQNVSEMVRAERVERWRHAFLGRWAADVHAQAAFTPRLASALMDTAGAPADFDALLAIDETADRARRRALRADPSLDPGQPQTAALGLHHHLYAAVLLVRARLAIPGLPERFGG